jgi:hypothetical protein
MTKRRIETMGVPHLDAPAANINCSAPGLWTFLRADLAHRVTAPGYLHNAFTKLMHAINSGRADFLVRAPRRGEYPFEGRDDSSYVLTDAGIRMLRFLIQAAVPATAEDRRLFQQVQAILTETAFKAEGVTE